MRVADLLQQEIAAILQKDVKDPRIGFITITGVDVTNDLSLAKVYYSVLGEESARKETAAGLKSAYPYIRGEVARRLQFKIAPELRFLYDASLDRAERLDQLLADAKLQGGDDDASS